MATALEFNTFLAKYGTHSRPTYSFHGPARCPSGGMVRYSTPVGEAVKHMTYKRGKLVSTTYSIPESTAWYDALPNE